MHRISVTIARWTKRVLRQGYLLWLAASDRRVPTIARGVAAAGAVYVISPIDLIPDEIPVIGELDDAAVAALALVVASRFIPTPLLAELRSKAAARFPDAVLYPPPEQQRMAYGVDPHRRERYSLRQARYDALARDINDWAADVASTGGTLSVLDVGCGSGLLLRHLEAKPNFGRLEISATDSQENQLWKKFLYREFFLGDLTGGYPQIASGAYDVVVCEQVLEHVKELDRAIDTLERLVKPGGRLVIGVPIFVPPLHWARMHVIPHLDRALGRRQERGHMHAFSMRSFMRHIGERRKLRLQSVRGFRVISGGILRPLENYRWWWRFNLWLGRRMPAACIEIQVVWRKKGGGDRPMDS